MCKVSHLVVLVILALIVSPLSFANENLIVNGGFEESSHSSWKNWGPGVRDFDNTEQVYSGEKSYKITLAKSARWNSEIAFQDDITGIQKGDKFEASAYLLIPESNPLSEHVEAYLELIFFDGEGNESSKFQSVKYGDKKPQSQWVKLTISDVAPGDAKECKLQIVVLPLPYLPDSKERDESYSGEVYFDDVSLSKK